MRTNKKLLIPVLGLVIVSIVLLFATSIRGSDPNASYSYHNRRSHRRRNIYEIAVPAYKSDAAYAMQAYERLMYEIITMNQNNMDKLDTHMKTVIKKLDSIEQSLLTLSARIVNIEKKLGIDQIKTNSPEKAD